MREYTHKTAVQCPACRELMVPDISARKSGPAVGWYCLNVECEQFTVEFLDIEDLRAVGVPEWVARLLVHALI
jgi:hypothetical protein